MRQSTWTSRNETYRMKFSRIPTFQVIFVQKSMRDGSPFKKGNLIFFWILSLKKKNY